MTYFRGSLRIYYKFFGLLIFSIIQHRDILNSNLTLFEMALLLGFS